MNCWFCGNEESVKNKEYKVKMFGDVSKDTDGAGGESVSFSRKTVTVPRCSSCKAKQSKAKVLTILSAFFLLGAILFGLFEIFNILQVISPWLRGFLFGLCLMLAIGIYLRKLLLMKGVKTQNNAKRNYPEIKELIAVGYEYGAAPKQKSEPKKVVTEVEDDVIN